MKRNLLLALMVSLFFGSNGFAQESEQQNPAIYRRSSLCLILMDEAKMPKRDVIKGAFVVAPMPDKYNDHNIAERCFCPDEMKITEEDKLAYKAAVLAGVKAEEDAVAKNADNASGEAPKKKGGGFGKALGGLGKSMLSGASGGLVDDADKSAYAICAHKYLLENKVAKQLFDKWFKDSTGNFSMELVQQRGKYDASAMDVETAKSTKRGMGLLEDAGEELINNTFVVVSRYRYISKDELCADLDKMAEAITKDLGGYASLGAKAGMMAVKASLGAGYYVQTTSFLFQLSWNPTIASKFYGELWSNPEAYESADIFSVKMIGQESAWANVKASIFTSKSEEELIQSATINAMDAVLAKLAKKYEVFKTKTPLYSADPEILAQIGMKEGVESGDKFEVLEQVVDPETGKTSYKRKCTLKVAKDRVWDNRYMADEERELTGEKQDITATSFEGNAKGLYPGLLLRQIK